MKGNLRTVFGRNVRILRKKMGFTLEELSGQIEVHSNYLGRVERGAENISLDNIEKLAGALGVPAGKLFLGEMKLKVKDPFFQMIDLLVKSLRSNKTRDRIHIIKIARLASRHLVAKK